MATSSITHSFVISDVKAAEKFAEIVDSPKVPIDDTVKYRIVSEPDEISSLLSAIRKKKSEH